MARQKKKSKMGWLIGVCLRGLFAVTWFLTPPKASFKQANTWQRAASPGRLSAAHAFLEQNNRWARPQHFTFCLTTVRCMPR